MRICAGVRVGVRARRCMYGCLCVPMYVCAYEVYAYECYCIHIHMCVCIHIHRLCEKKHEDYLDVVSRHLLGAISIAPATGPIEQ